LRVAIIHDWYDRPGGAERVVEALLEIYPEAELFAIVDFFSDEDRQKYLKGKSVKTSFIQLLPFAKRYFRHYFALMAYAIESFDLREYDLVISSSHAFAKGVITTPNQKHICYCYTPMRYIWDMQRDYFEDNSIKGFKKIYLSYLFHRVRIWDYINSQRVDRFISISNFISDRIKRYYSKDSTIIYPPVNTDRFTFVKDKEDYYFTASRLVPYKQIRLIAEVFAKNGKKLIIAGDGPDRAEIESRVGGNTVMLGSISDSKMVSLMQRAKAFIFASYEDFGIVPVEAMSCGTPVIAYGKGGAKDTVIDGKTGVLFKEQSIESLQSAIDRFEEMSFDYEYISNYAKRFSKERFKKEFREFVDINL